MKVIIDELSNISDWIYTDRGNLFRYSHYIYSANNSGNKF